MASRTTREDRRRGATGRAPARLARAWLACARAWPRCALPGAWALTLAAAVAAGCESGAIVEVTADRKVYHIAFDVQAPELPRGGFDLSLGFLGMDLTFPDAFGRATGPLGHFGNIPTAFGEAPGFTIAPALRNASADPRAPALLPGNGGPGGYLGLFPPAFAGIGPGWWNLLGEVRGLQPNSVYTVVLARMALEVRGGLDQPGVLTGEPDPTADSLYYLGGEPSGNSTSVLCAFEEGIPVDAGRNPVALGFIVTDATGAAVIDCLPVAVGTSPWWRDNSTYLPATALDSLPFGSNAPGETLLPGQYNYVLLIPGQGTDANPIPPGRPVLRAQVGPDIDADGKVIANAFAPFPSGPMPEEELVLAPGARGVPNGITVTVEGLPELTGNAVYKAWLFNGEDPSRAPVAAMGEITYVEGAETRAGGTAATFRGGPGVVTTLAVSDATLGTARVRDFDHIAIAVHREGDSASPAPAALWARYVDHRGTPGDFFDNINFNSGTLRFGTFQPDAVVRSRDYAPGGTIRGSFYRDTLLVLAEGAAVPPPGFHYELWLQPAGGGAPRNVGSLPVDERGIGSQRIAEGIIGRFGEYTGVDVTLEANEAPASPGPFRVFSSEDWTVKFRDIFRAQ